MNSDIKPIIEQLKNKLNSKDMEQLKQQVSFGVQVGQQFVKAKSKELLEQSKNSKVVNEVVVPWLESEAAAKAIETMNSKLKLKDTPLMNTILKIRQDLIDSKVSSARDASIPATETNTSPGSETTPDSSN